MNFMLNKVFGSRNARLLKELSKYVVQINRLETDMQNLSDSELAAKTPELKDKIAQDKQWKAYFRKRLQLSAKCPDEL